MKIMNKEKQDLLNNPLVKEIAMEYVDNFRNPEHITGQTLKEVAWKLYFDKQQPPKEWLVIKVGSHDFNSTVDSDTPPNAPIYSVKRLSDGEVFTVGDKITGGYFQDAREIVGFFEERNGLWIKLPGSVSALGDSKKAKPPLFTTEDGKEIFEGDIYWIVDKRDFDILEKAVPMCFPSAYWSFSTKEAAEEYVLNYKPVLSLKDIYAMAVSTTPANAFSGQVETIEIPRKELEELAKSKLK